MVWWWDVRLRLQYPNYVHKLCYTFLSAFHTHSSNSIFANTGSTSVSAKARTDANAIALLLLFLAHIHILPYKYVHCTGYRVQGTVCTCRGNKPKSSSVERFVNDIYNICTHNVSFIAIVAALYSQEKHAIWIYYVDIMDDCNIQRLEYNEVAF